MAQIQEEPASAKTVLFRFPTKQKDLKNASLPPKEKNNHQVYTLKDWAIRVIYEYYYVKMQVSSDC